MKIDQNTICWPDVQRVLVIKLRSIGDTVLSTPSLIALRRFVPNAQIDILLENWVAPLLAGHESIDNVISVGKGANERVKTALQLRRRKYDVVFNLHGGTTATFFTAASRAKHRVGYADYQYSFLHNHRLSSSADFWRTEFTHSAEQQLALLGFVGIPVEDRPKSRLTVTSTATETLGRRISEKMKRMDEEKGFALVHPASLFATKQWSIENFARTAEFLADRGIRTIAVGSQNEIATLQALKDESNASIQTFHDLTLPEIIALASVANVFVGNDSGIAHIAASVGTPSVVIFGSSNRNHWRPWTDSPNEIVFEPFACQPCPGYICAEFGDSRCILRVTPQAVFKAINRVLERK